MPVWRARAISRETHDLGIDAVAYADRLIAATPAKIGLVDAARLVDEARLYFDPDRALADEEHQLARRGVWVKHTGNPATTDVIMTLETPDALLFDQTVTRIAAELRDLGDTDHLDVRRAKAVGVIADPQYALDLMSGRDDAAPTVGCSGGALDLFVHLTPADLAPGTGAATVEKLGAMTTAAPRRSGSPATPRPAGRSPSARSSTSDPTRLRWTSTTHPLRCASSACCVTPTASSPAADATPGAATSTTSPPTSPWPRADRRARPTRSTWRRCAGPTTGSRPSPPGTTNAATTAPTPGPAPTGHQYDVHPVSRRPPARRT